MNIGIFYRKPFETGGVEKTMIERGRLLKELGHNITYLFSDKSSSINTLEKFAEIGDVRRSDHLDRSIDVMIYDSIYGNIEIPAEKTIQVYNGNVIDGNEQLSKINADINVSVSHECQKQLKEKYNVDSIIIPNVINTEKIKELSKEKYEIPKKEYNFVVVSRIDEQKGFENLVKLIQEIDSKTKDYQFVIVGSNLNYPRYGEQLKERLKNYNVIWEGLQDNPYKYMANADYLVQLSKYESQCIAMFESLILGTPVIVTDFGTAKETVTDERGFVIKQDLSNLDINTILNKKGKFKFNFEYEDVKEKWKEIIKIPPMKDKKFSIIIPNYNNAEWLDKCLISVANQTYKNYEVIFIDDMSTDNSVDIAHNYIKKIKEFKIIKLKQKRYNGGARNVGIEEATGDYTMFIDSDDWLKDENVLYNINKAIRNEDVLRLGYSLSNGEKHDLFIDIPKHNTMYDIFIEPTCAIWTKVIKTNIIKKVLFKEGTLMEDRTHHYRLIEKCRTFKDYKDYTHVWNRANSHSTTTKRNYFWNSSAYRHLADMIDFIEESNNEQYKQFVRNKIEQHKNNIRNGIYSQL